MIKVLHPSFFAREDTKTPMIYAGIAMAANVVLSLTLFLLIGATGIAIATTLSGWINVALLIGKLRQRDGFSARSDLPPPRLPASLAASAVMGVVVFALVRLLDPWFAPAERAVRPSDGPRSPWSRLGLLTYLGAAHLFGAAKFRDLIKDTGP